MCSKISLNTFPEMAQQSGSVKKTDTNNIQLIDAQCRVEQAQGLLSIWMEANISDNMTITMMGALMTLLEGVPESIGHAGTELFHYENGDHIVQKKIVI